MTIHTRYVGNDFIRGLFGSMFGVLAAADVCICIRLEGKAPRDG